ncbi:hypothetical protein PHYC_00284 [Phycisphaerales bacterium]|nr:hypothetical protein PHYC_00284 [Phycisphaerales bacterium]
MYTSAAVVNVARLMHACISESVCCQARARLPLTARLGLMRQGLRARADSAKVRAAGRWRGYRMLLNGGSRTAVRFGAQGIDHRLRIKSVC